MAQFATAEELGDYLGRPIRARQRKRAELVLRLASGEVQSFTRQRLEYTANDTAELRAPAGGGWELWLPERPVLSVASISQGGVALGGLVVHRYGMVEVAYGSILAANASPELRRPGRLLVTYSHGYYVRGPLPVPNPEGVTLMPDDIVGVVLAAAARSFDNPGALSAQSVGGYSVTYGYTPTGGVKLSAEERRTLRRYRPTAA